MKQKTVVCLGDSITEGYPFSKEQSWVSILNHTNTHCFINKGISGQTSFQIATRFERDVLLPHPNYVCLLFGTNDFIFTNATVEDVLEQTATMALTAKKCDIVPLVFSPIFTIPEIAVHAWEDGTDYIRVNNSLVKLNHLLAGLCAAAKIPYLDLQSSYQELVSHSSPHAYYIDGIHPTALGYKAIADIVSNFTLSLKQLP